MTSALLDDLAARGLVENCTDLDGLRERLDASPITLYCGFDPTADSLHIGHLVALTMLRRFQMAGHQPIPLVGGATGMVGDPSGRSEERNLLDTDTLADNVACIREQMERFLDFGDIPNLALMLDNAHWLTRWDLISFLRDVGKHFSVNTMIAKESVKKRLDVGISFTEFSYQILQSMDFLHLYQNHDCELQIGGSDQWGNITAGIDLIRRIEGGEAKAYGLVVPLITQASGEKFGKTAKGAVWLDPQQTSVYDFYQYFINRDDRDVASQLKVFTFLDVAEIDDLVAEHEKAPEQRLAQRRLAEEVTTLVHGEKGLALARRITEVFFPSKKAARIEGFTDDELLPAFRDVPSARFDRERLEAGGIPLAEALAACELAKSKSEARRLLKQGGIAVNNVKVGSGKDAEDRILRPDDLATETCIVLRSGKKNYGLLRFD